MKIHLLKSEAGVTSCCGVFRSFLPYGEMVTVHREIVTCWAEPLKCPACKNEATEIDVRIADVERSGEPSDLERERIVPRFGSEYMRMCVRPCGHRFRVAVSLDMRLRIEEIESE